MIGELAPPPRSSCCSPPLVVQALLAAGASAPADPATVKASEAVLDVLRPGAR